MATTEDGDLGIIPVTTSQTGKVNSFNGHVSALNKSGVGMLNLDLDGLGGSQTLTESYTQNGIIVISGALISAVTLNLDADITQPYWIHDVSTGYDITVQSTGGAGVLMPKKRWVQYYAAPSFFTVLMSGWQASAQSPAMTYAAAYQVVAARPLKLRKEGENTTIAGGRVTLEGAVEETTTPPAAGDTIVTLPANYRPSHAVGFVVLADPVTAGTAQPVAIEIQTSGAVILRSLLGWTPLVNKPIDLSGVSFFVGN